MLQQMSSPSSAPAGEVDLVRPFEIDFSAASQLEPLQQLLPQSKTRRNYSCTKCTFHTRNSRDFLWHSRDVHFEKLKIYECPHCVYACRHYQKLVRHLKVHTELPSDSLIRMESEAGDSVERIEDFLEEVEECEEEQVDSDEGAEELMEQSPDADAEQDLERAEEATTSESSKVKKNFFMCNKCNYVTHIRGRYTKHVKYHSMPMIKCTMCEFRTPYKCPYNKFW